MLCQARLGEFDPARFLFIDETHSDERQARRARGWAKRGRTPTVFSPLNNRRFTVIAACNLWGFEMDVCEVIELEPGVGVSGDRFEQWVQEKLVASDVLGNYLAGGRNSVVVLDNASIHKSNLPRVLQLIRGAGAAVEFLSPYSPDLNPIEEAFSKVKSIVRRERQLFLSNPRACLATALARVTAEDMHGYFRHSGYNVPNLQELRVVAAAAAAAAITVSVVGAVACAAVHCRGAKRARLA